MTQHEPPTGWQVQQLLAQIAAKLDVLIAQGTDHEARIRILEKAPPAADLDSRLRTLEKSRWPLANVGALTGIGALIVAILVAVLKH